MSMPSTKDEVELLNLKPHWSILLPAFVWIIIGVLTLLIFIGVVFLLIGVVRLILGIVAMNSNYLKLTNKRVYLKSGLLHKEEFDIKLDKLDGAQVSRPLLQRILGCGSVTVRSSGSSHITFGPVQDPDKVRQAIADAADAI